MMYKVSNAYQRHVKALTMMDEDEEVEEYSNVHTLLLLLLLLLPLT